MFYSFIYSRPESKLVEEIVEDILKKINQITLQYDFKDPIGIHKHIKEVELLLRIGSPNILIIGI